MILTAAIEKHPPQSDEDLFEFEFTVTFCFTLYCNNFLWYSVQPLYTVIQTDDAWQVPLYTITCVKEAFPNPTRSGTEEG